MPANPLSPQELEQAARLKRHFEQWQRNRKAEGQPSSQEAAAAQLGFGQSALNQYLNGKIPLNVEAAIKFAKLLDVAVADFSPAMANQAASYVSAVESTLPPNVDLPFLGHARRTTVDAPAESIPIKKVSLTLQAGIMGFEATQDISDDSAIDIPRAFIEQNDLVPQCLLAIDIKGDSMWPLMIEGDTVVINIADTRPINGELYALNFEGEAVVKQMVLEGREWYLVSMNPKFKRRVCRGGECIVVGRVVYQPGRKLIGRV